MRAVDCWAGPSDHQDRRQDRRSGAPTGRSRWLPAITRPPAAYGANLRQESGDCKSRDSDRAREQARAQDDSNMNTILIVDDDPYLLDCLHQTLIMFGYRVIAAQDAETALAVIHNGAKIELVITDYQMPTIDGLELTARLNRIVPA